MTDRKQTPDVLGAVLGAQPEPSTPAPIQAAAPAKRARQRKPRRKLERKATRRQWEYRTITFSDYRGFRPRYIDNEEQPDWKKSPTMPEYLDEMGAEGWEMAGMNNGGWNEILAIFKRPKI